MIEIRLERESDRRRVHDVEAAAFEGTLQARIVEALRASADPQLSLVATIGDDVVGHIFFSPATLEKFPAEAVAQLSPLAVDPSHQRNGIGKALVVEGLTRAREAGWNLVFLLGDPRYYSRFGFVLAEPLGFSMGDPKADPALQLLELQPGASSGRYGRLRFHPAFETATP